MKNILFCLLLAVPALGTAQPQGEVFRSVYDTLFKKSQNAYLGIKEGEQNQFAETFTRLSWNFSDDDLTYIALNSNPVMEASATVELVNRKSQTLEALFIQQLSSPDKITIYNGKTVRDYRLAAALFKSLAYQKEKKERKAYYEKTSTPEQLRGLKALFGSDFDSKWSVAETDSLMAKLSEIALGNNATSPETLSRICQLIQFHCNDYARIRYLAQKYPTPELLATLASFKNKNDLALIKSHLEDAMIAISLYPHPVFLPGLKARLDSDFRKPEYQLAVAAYKSKVSKMLLQSICKKLAADPGNDQRDQQLFALRSLLEKADCPLYSDLIAQLEKNI